MKVDSYRGKTGIGAWTAKMGCGSNCALPHPAGLQRAQEVQNVLLPRCAESLEVGNDSMGFAIANL